MRTRLHQLAHQRLRDGLHHDGDLVAAGLLFAASVLDQLRGASWRSSDGGDGPGGVGGGGSAHPFQLGPRESGPPELLVAAKLHRSEVGGDVEPATERGSAAP